MIVDISHLVARTALLDGQYELSNSAQPSEVGMELTELKLTEPELKLMTSLVRQAIRKAERNRKTLARKFGDEADFTQIDGWLGVLESIYRQLGKDPDNITIRD